MSSYFKVLLTIISFILYLSSGEQDYCGDEFYHESDLRFEDCDIKNRFYYFENFITATENLCFPSCQPIKPGEQCSHNKPCPPGYDCIPQGETEEDFEELCQVNEKSCFIYHHDHFEEEKYGSALWKPDCLNDGSWAAKQCKGEAANGRCFCFNAVGKRIFGEAKSTQADKMTCACSRRRDELEKSAKDDEFFSLHCDAMGNYEPLQCALGQCWCVQRETGDVTAPVVPESLMSFLPCYLKENVGGQYLRECESTLYAQTVLKYEFLTHGTTDLFFEEILCDADGSYGKYKVVGNAAHCTLRNGLTLGYTGSKLDEMNCNCARDSRNSEGDFKLACEADTGNYKPLQKLNNKNYCVDSDGFVKSPEDAEIEKETNCEDYY